MKISIIAYGTRGDVQPVIALGKALQAAGHRVRLLAGTNFAAWIQGHGLAAFLDAGPPPVYVGFGSMTGRDPHSLTELIVRAVAAAGQRAVLQAGWAGMGQIDLPPDIHRLDVAPHHRLFPRMAAVVHHGGAGTTAEGLRAGVPSIVVPHMADQPFWGARVAALGAGPAPIPRADLTAEGLAAALHQAVGDAGIRRRAAELGAAIRAEDGLGAAVGLVEAFAQGGRVGTRERSPQRP